MSFKHDLLLSRKPLAGFVAIGMAWAVYFAQMPVIKAQVGASDGEYGMALLVASFGAIAAMWLAPACQRFAGGFATSLGIVVLGIGMVSAGASTGLTALMLAMLLASMGSGVIDVLVNARVSEIEEQSGRPLMNLNHALYAFAYSGGALATGFFRSEGVTPVPILTGLFVVLMVLAWAARDVAPQVEAHDNTADVRLPYALVLLVGFVVLAAFLTEAATEGWSALHLERTLGGSAGQGAMGPAVLGLMMGIGRLMGHGLSRRFRDTHLMLVATLISACGVMLAGMAPTVGTGLLGFAIAGLGISVVAPLVLSLLGRVVPAHQRLAAISRASVIGYGAFFFGPPLMGLVAEGFGLRAAFYVIAGLLVVVAFALIPALARRTG
ncbi:MAG: MFS transporter [Sulfitobacter sp.]